MGRMKMPQKGQKFFYGKYTNNNSKSAGFGKTYGRAAIFGTLDTEDIAEHMMNHGCVYGVDVIKGVLDKFFDCAIELLFTNYRIKMNGLGTLCMTLTSKGSDSAGEFTESFIEKANIRLLPDATMDQQLSGKKLRERMSFANVAASSFISFDAASGEGGGEGDQGGNGGNGGDDIDDLP